MKKTYIFALILILVVTLSLGACAKEEAVSYGGGNITSVNNLFMDKNILKVYKGGINEIGQVTIQQKLSDGRIQLSSMGDSHNLIEVYQINDEGLLIVDGDEVEDFSRKYTHDPNAFESIVIKEPIKLGDVWGPEGYETKVTGVDVKVKTPYGEFNTLELSLKGNDYVVKLYYANDLGLVKYVVNDETFFELYSVRPYDKDITKMSKEKLTKLFEKEIAGIEK